MQYLQGVGHSPDDGQSCSSIFWLSSHKPELWAPLCLVSPIRGADHSVSKPKLTGLPVSHESVGVGLFPETESQNEGKNLNFQLIVLKVWGMLKVWGSGQTPPKYATMAY